MTRKSYLWTYLLNAPLHTLYALLIYVLRRELGANVLQMTLFASIQPVTGLLAAYWSHRTRHRQLKDNIVWIGILGKLPSLFLPFIHSTWLFIGAFALYMAAERAVMPAWMETLRRNLSPEERTRAVSRKSLYIYLVNLFLPLLWIFWIDDNIDLWKWGFSICTLISLVPVFFQRRLVIPPRPPVKLNLRMRPDFALFQGLFFLGGLGLMVIMPTLPFVLTIPYSRLTLAVLVSKAIGFAIANPFWRGAIQRTNLYRLCAYVTLLAAAFPLLILGGAPYLAFLIYGMMQAGSELSWQLSGTIFARNENSSSFTATNILMVGIRGLFGPALGSYVMVLTGSPTWSLLMGALFCLSGTLVGTWGSRKYGADLYTGIDGSLSGTG